MAFAAKPPRYSRSTHFWSIGGKYELFYLELGNTNGIPETI